MTTERIPSEMTVLLDPSELRSSLKRDARDSLTAAPRTLSPKYFYDDRGSQLFEEITRLPEYYPTRAERALLHRYAGEMAELAGAESLVELGSGSSEKTRALLDAMDAAGRLISYVPVDVSAGALRGAASGLQSSRPELPVHAVAPTDPLGLRHRPLPSARDFGISHVRIPCGTTAAGSHKLFGRRRGGFGLWDGSHLPTSTEPSGNGVARGAASNRPTLTRRTPSQSSAD